MINGQVEESPHRLFYDRLLSYAFIDSMFPLCTRCAVLVLFVLLSGVLAVTGSYMYFFFFCTLHQEFGTCVVNYHNVRKSKAFSLQVTDDVGCGTVNYFPRTEWLSGDSDLITSSAGTVTVTGICYGQRFQVTRSHWRFFWSILSSRLFSPRIPRF